MRSTILICFVLLLFSCRRESFTNSADARLTLSADTLRFDTVFTTTGSVTQAVKIFNTNHQGIRIGSVQLKGGNASPFRLNINGQAGAQTANLEIGANDSAYIFVSVRIDPTAANLPFVVRDSIELLYNGNTEWIQLEAYGQNARFLRNRVISSDEVWEKDLPYVILGGMEVAPNTQLIIKAGCRIYLHADAPFLVNGTLLVQGGQGDSNRVVFSGNRLDEPYNKFPAAWPGIYFTATSKDNLLQHAQIKNAYQAVVVQEPAAASSNPKLKIRETEIDNAYDAGILALNTSLRAQNLLVSNCGKNVVLLKGGSYQFDHCTLAAASSSFLLHKEPVLQVSDAALQNGSVVTSSLTATFRNCIFWGEGGDVEDEVRVDRKGTSFSLSFDHVLWKVAAEPADATVVSAINEDPQFEWLDAETKTYTFRLQESSPALDKGRPTGITTDLDGNPRPVGLPDLGAFEKQ